MASIAILEKRHCADVSRIWVAGLRQTVDSSGCCSRPFWSWLMKSLVSSATSEDGEMNPDGTNLLNIWSGKSDRTMLIAEIDGAVVGCCAVKRGEQEKVIADDNCTVFSVYRLSVDEKSRQKGIATKLMRSAEEWAKAHGGLKITLFNANNVAGKFFCEKMGYKKTGLGGIQYVKDLI